MQNRIKAQVSRVTFRWKRMVSGCRMASKFWSVPSPFPHPTYHWAVRAGVDISQSRYDSCGLLWVIIYYEEVSLQWKAFFKYVWFSRRRAPMWPVTFLNTGKTQRNSTLTDLTMAKYLGGIQTRQKFIWITFLDFFLQLAFSLLRCFGRACWLISSCFNFFPKWFLWHIDVKSFCLAMFHSLSHTWVCVKNM